MVPGIQNNFLELTRCAVPLCNLSGACDLPPGALLVSGRGNPQTDQRRLHEATRPSLRDMIDPALSGLSNLPDTKGHGASTEHQAHCGAGPASARGCIARDRDKPFSEPALRKR